jgi:hypothetical protein
MTAHFTPVEINLVSVMRAFVDERIGLLAKPTAALSPKPRFTHDPAWKSQSSGGLRLTEAGVIAIGRMFEAGLSNREVADVMKIGLNSAATYRRRYEGRTDWGTKKPKA